MIPTIFKYTGDEHEGKKLTGTGRRRLNKLLTDASFQQLKTHKDNPLISPDGSKVSCFTNHKVNEVHIHVTKQKVHAGDDWEVKELDNRFFVRVGRPDDIIIDGFGHIVRDRTRYYWIDFNAHKDATTDVDKIGFAKTTANKRLVLTEGGVRKYVRSRQISKQDFLSVVNFPDYMLHNYIRSFDFVREESKPKKIDRFVAGYHFIASWTSIIAMPEVPVPAGGSVDLSGNTKNPANRFYVDTPSKTMCWYHVLQRWPESSIIRESTGSMSGIVVGADFDAEKKVWAFPSLRTFTYSGSIGSGYGISSTGNNDMYEPTCVVSDVISLNRNEITLNMPYQSAPIILKLSVATGAVISCTSSDHLETASPNATGYELYQSGTYYNAEGEGRDNITGEETFVANDYDVADCTVYTTPESCAAVPFELSHDETEYAESYYDWSETTINISVLGLAGKGYTAVINGRNAVSKSESVMSVVHFCTGMCDGSEDSNIATKILTGVGSGYFGTVQYATIPCQNVAMVSNEWEIVNVNIQRTIVGPYGSTFDSWGQCVSVWGAAAPWDGGETAWGEGAATTAYPQGYAIEDPANWLPLENMPVPIPDLVSQIDISTQTWYGPSVPGRDVVNTIDKCVIQGCPDEKTASELYSVSILDDRMSFGSQGIVISAKSHITSESAIYHDGRNKTQAILQALVRDKLLKPGEALYDIGLI